MKNITTHEEQLAFLNKIEGQIRGIQRMIKEGRYCVDILTQLHSIVGAIASVESKIFKKHIEGCVIHALKNKSEIQKQKKIDEIVDLINRFKRGN